MTEKVHEQLTRMHRNFDGLAEQFQVLGEDAAKAMKPMSRAISRLAGQVAAREDWSDTLWPTHEETRENDDDTDLRS